MANISPTIKIDISIKNGIVEEIIIGASCTPQEITTYKALFQEYRDLFAWSYSEMPSLDPSIVEHRINTWPDITPVHQKQRLLHPSKSMAIKVEIDKLRVVEFIYPSPIPHGFPTLYPLTKNRALSTFARTFTISIMRVPKTTFQHLSSIKLSTTAQATRFYPLWIDSLVIIKFKFTPSISIKPHSLPCGVLFHIVSCLSS
jgi:hypothetical protein